MSGDARAAFNEIQQHANTAGRRCFRRHRSSRELPVTAVADGVGAPRTSLCDHNRATLPGSEIAGVGEGDVMSEGEAEIVGDSKIGGHR